MTINEECDMVEDLIQRGFVVMALLRIVNIMRRLAREP